MALYDRPNDLLRRLVQFDTTNGTQSERECIQYINGLLTEAGIETTIVAKQPDRPNLIARLEGRGDAPPLLLYGHVDVVTTAGQRWSYPPFAAEEHEGFIWGRGTLDMKSGVAMMLAAFLKAHAEDAALPGDVILCVLSDEEAGGFLGARYLVEEHPYLFEGVRYALGEFGGFSMQVGGQRFYPIMVAEKVGCPTRAIFTAEGGHAALPAYEGGALAQAAAFITAVSETPLPIHVTTPVAHMLQAIGVHMDFPSNVIFKQLTNPTAAPLLLGLLGDLAGPINALLRNTVSPTMVQASDHLNVLPTRVELGLDIRLLPGFTPEDVYREIREISPVDVQLEAINYESGPAEPDMGLFDVLANAINARDPAGHPVPYVLPMITDGRHFAQLGIQTYGFTPMQLPADFSFISTIHTADERIPVDAMAFGTQAISKVLTRFTGGA